ncbi:MAG: SusC/RagA family TonB-linked outer membrane protein, partial [Bacteroidota bacterium]
MQQFLLRRRLIMGSFLLMLGLSLQAQFAVQGRVTDNNGEALIGVSILAEGTSTGTVTDFDGNFTLNVPDQVENIILSYTGFASQTLAVNSGMGPLVVTMEEDIARLDEVVVTGLASSVKRSNLANAVATVSSEELTGVTTQQTVDGALYGKLTGVNITQTTGAPGGGFSLRLRGISSLSGNNQPLFIVDGVYISNIEIPNGSRFASGANSGSEEGSSNRIADLNPDDIESIEVLKGASAAAIYGTRANAGVIIITTKRGQSGRTDISFNQDIGFNTIINKVGRRQFTADQVEAEFGGDTPAQMAAGRAERARFEAAQAAGQIFDYEDIIYGEEGLITDSRLRISGGNQRTNFMFSVGYRDEAGIVLNTGYERFTTRLNLSHQLSDKIKISSYTNFINSNAQRSFSGNENEGGLSYGYTLAFTRDWVNLFPDENGIYPDNPNFSGNPLQTRDETQNDESINRVIQGVAVDVNLLQTDNQVLRLALNGGLDFFVNETFVYVPETFQSQRGGQNGFIGQGNNQVFNFNYNAIAVHDFYTESGINFTTQAGISYLNFDNDFVFSQTTQLLPLQTSLTQGGAQSTTQTTAPVEEFGIIAQEEVNFNDRIIATVGVRFDKSTLNGDPNKLFAFPKASLALNLTEFDFLKNNSTFDQLKLRAAYGQTGNSASFGNLFTSLTLATIGGRTGASLIGTQGDPNLQPERSDELEFGADFGFFDNKLALSVSYYLRDVNNLLYNRALPTSSGFTSEIRNDLDLRNRGLEVQLALNPVRTSKFDWRSTINFWFNRSEVRRLGVPDGDNDPNDVPSFVPPGVAFGLGLGTFFIDEGSPITGLWNAGPTLNGDVEPDFQLGWANNISFGNFDFNFLVHWKEGGDALNLSRLLTNIGNTTPREFDD